jgi:hypothetical protein
LRIAFFLPTLTLSPLHLRDLLFLSKLDTAFDFTTDTSSLRSIPTDTMGDATIVASNWRNVEVGRVLLLQGAGPYAGRLATIVEIIDHKRVGLFGLGM